MKILWLNDKDFGGGAGRLFFNAEPVLLENGHDVMPFIGKRVRDYTDAQCSLQPSQPVGGSILENLVRSYPSRQVSKKLRHVLDEYRPTVSIVQNLHQYLHPGLIRTLHERRIPIVYVANDHAVWCVNKYGFREGGPCTKCIDGKFERGIELNCGLTPGAIGQVRTRIRTHTLKYISKHKLLSMLDAVFTTGDTVADILQQLGIEERKIHQGIWPREIDAATAVDNLPEKPYFVYYGQANEVKGLEVLLEALQRIPESIDLRIYPMGEFTAEANQLLEVVRKQGTHSILVDRELRWETGLREIVAEARGVLIPNAWHAPHDLVFYEALSMGKAVITASQCGNADVVENEKDALVFEMGNAQDLAEKWSRLANDPKLAIELGHAALQTWNAKLAIKNFYSGFRACLDSAIDNRSQRT